MIELIFEASKSFEAEITEPKRSVLFFNEKGEQGATWFYGAADPREESPAGAREGDFYLRSDANVTVFRFEGGYWGPLLTLKGASGMDGDDGVGIASIQRTAGTGAPGTTDTYTITYTNGATSTFNVTNGANGNNGALWFSGSGAPSNAVGANGDYYLRTSNGDVFTKAAGAWTSVGNIRGPAGPDRLPTTGSGPVTLVNGEVQIARRVDTWANRSTGLFVGELLVVSDWRALFYWNGSRWLPASGRVRIFSSTVLAGAGTATAETAVRQLTVPQGLCEVGCVIRVIGLSTWSSNVTTAKTAALKISNTAGADITTVNAIASRQGTTSSSSGYIGFNKPILVRSTNQIWTGSANLDVESIATVGLTPNFINGVNCLNAWTMWLTHTKPQSGDTFDSQYFMVDIEFPLS